MKGLLAAILLLVGAAAQAQKTKRVNVRIPAAVQSSFRAAHPAASPSWEKEHGNYEAAFKEAGKAMSCVLTSRGIIIETETSIAISELPPATSTWLHAHYPGVPVKEAARIVDDKGTVTFEAGLSHKDVLFDQHGRFIREAKD